MIQSTPNRTNQVVISPGDSGMKRVITGIYQELQVEGILLESNEPLQMHTR